MKRFMYPKEFVTLPDYTAHAGQIIKVLGIHPDSQDDPEMERLFSIRAEDGWEGCAFEGELVEAQP